MALLVERVGVLSDDQTSCGTGATPWLFCRVAEDESPHSPVPAIEQAILGTLLGPSKLLLRDTPVEENTAARPLGNGTLREGPSLPGSHSRGLNDRPCHQPPFAATINGCSIR